MRIPRTNAVRREAAQSRVVASTESQAATNLIVAGSTAVRPSGLCELACNALPEPARSICKAAC